VTGDQLVRLVRCIPLCVVGQMEIPIDKRILEGPRFLAWLVHGARVAKGAKQGSQNIPRRLEMSLLELSVELRTSHGMIAGIGFQILDLGGSKTKSSA